MTELISSRDTLDFLSRSAPRPWVKRMLSWMIFNGEISAFARKGRSVASTHVFQIVYEALGGMPQSAELDDLIRKNFDADLAERLIVAGEYGRIGETVFEWGEDEEVRMLSSGYILHASKIDWEAGLISVLLYSGHKIGSNDFVNEEELFSSQFPEPEYDIQISGLCFGRESLELLQPHVELGQGVIGRSEASARLGRPRIWDWESATAHLLSVAQTPDGLPIGPGAQAQIERLIAEWFMSSAGNSPAVSQVRNHATKIMKALEKPKSR